MKEAKEAAVSTAVFLKDVDSKFRFITVAAQRAKQLQAGAKPRVEARSRKSTRIAMQEVVAGTVSWEFDDESGAPVAEPEPEPNV